MSIDTKQWGIHWFRRDLRIAGNPAFRWNWKNSQGRTLGIFFFDSKFLSRPDFSHNRFGFFLQTLKTLQLEMREAGGDLLVLDRGPDTGFEWLFSKFKSHPPTFVTWNRDYEPFARDRDARILQWLEGRRVQVHSERDHLIFEPGEIPKEIKGEAKKGQSNSFYQIYTPFSKKWASRLLSEEGQSRVKVYSESLQYLEKKLKGEEIEPFLKWKWTEVLNNEDCVDSLEGFIQKNSPMITVPLPPAGSGVAFKQAKLFSNKISEYLKNRDFPSLVGTSHLSIYFKNGSITPGMVIASLGLNKVNIETKSGSAQFLKELIWREFYYHILYYCPNVENESFLPQYRQIRWENNENWFQAWKDGRTGFPIVDAGMRELKQTGLMHNRVRMIVASFLTKDLLIDWRWGERYFMNQLLDGDLAPNNGGWQWAASTGCDPQPYFRVFNPELQSEKFDPDGDYIKRFIPELKRVPSSEIHAPLGKYIQPIVSHPVQKMKAISLYRKPTPHEL